MYWLNLAWLPGILQEMRYSFPAHFLKVMFKQWLWETENSVRLGSVIIRSHSPANFDCNNSLYHIYIGVIKEHLSRTSIIHIKLLLNKDVKQRGLKHSILPPPKKQCSREIYAAYLQYNYLFVSCIYTQIPFNYRGSVPSVVGCIMKWYPSILPWSSSLGCWGWCYSQALQREYYHNHESEHTDKFPES